MDKNYDNPQVKSFVEAAYKVLDENNYQLTRRQINEYFDLSTETTRRVFGSLVTPFIITKNEPSAKKYLQRIKAVNIPSLVAAGEKLLVFKPGKGCKIFTSLEPFYRYLRKRAPEMLHYVPDDKLVLMASIATFISSDFGTFYDEYPVLGVIRKEKRVYEIHAYQRRFSVSCGPSGDWVTVDGKRGKEEIKEDRRVSSRQLVDRDIEATKDIEEDIQVTKDIEKDIEAEVDIVNEAVDLAVSEEMTALKSQLEIALANEASHQNEIATLRRELLGTSEKLNSIEQLLAVLIQNQNIASEPGNYQSVQGNVITAETEIAPRKSYLNRVTEPDSYNYLGSQEYYNDDSAGDNTSDNGDGYENSYPDGTYPDGTYADGTYDNDNYPDGSYDNDTYPDGSYDNGTYPDGTYPDGTYPQEDYDDTGYLQENYDTAQNNSNASFAEPVVLPRRSASLFYPSFG